MRWIEHRVDFFLHIFPSTFGILTTLLGVFVIFNNIETIIGWDKYEIILITGVYYLVVGLYFPMFIQTLSRIGELVNRGGLDFVLLKPVSSLFTVSFFSGVSYAELPRLLGAFIVIPIAIIKLGLLISWARWLGFALMIISAVVLAYSIWTLVMTTSFWLGRIHGFHEVPLSLFRINKYPLDIFNKGLRILFLAILPIGFMVYVPTKFLLGDLGWEWVLLSLLLSSIFLFSTIKFWDFGLKAYSSASS